MRDGLNQVIFIKETRRTEACPDVLLRVESTCHIRKAVFYIYI